MLRCLRRFLALCCALVVVHVPAAEAKRVALVIGNAAYKVGPLQNPVNDATAVATALSGLGFDKVLLRKDLGVNAFRAALDEMARESAGADLGAIFFAGHGTEVAGRNFLIPVDATLARASALDLEAIPLDTVLSQLDRVKRLKLVILDACRNNPFAPAGAKRAVSRGLARIEPEDNTLVVYAAKDGTTAEDGIGKRHSPFTEAFLKHLPTPGLEINLLFRRVRDDVMRATSHESEPQQPHVYAALGGQELYLAPATPFAAVVTPADPGPSRAEVAQLCESVAKNTSLKVVESLLGTYRGTPTARCIEARIQELRKQAAAVVPPASKPAGPETGKDEKASARRAAALKCCMRGQELYAASIGRPDAAETGRKLCTVLSPSDLYTWCDFHKRKHNKDAAAQAGVQLSPCTCP